MVVKEKLPDNNEKQNPSGENETNWKSVFDRVRELNIPDNLHQRAKEITKLFPNGVDIEMFGRAIHDVLVPEATSIPVERKMTVISPESGEIKRTFLDPAERKALYDHAAKVIHELAKMPRTPDQDKVLLMRTANVIAMTIVLTHSYENGNGRLARVMAELIRYGTEHPDDIKLIGTERDTSQSQMGGFRIDSYLQKGSSIENGDNEYDVINYAASLGVPLAEIEVYTQIVNRIFTTTHELS